jgi:hypothetical protein
VSIVSDREARSAATGRIRLLLGVRGEIESATHCVSDDHALHHLNGALAMLAGAERDLEVVIADAYKHGFADSYAKQVIAEMEGEPGNLWCAVEGCHEPPMLYDLETSEFVCRGHFHYGAECVDPGCPFHGDDPMTLVLEDEDV